MRGQLSIQDRQAQLITRLKNINQKQKDITLNYETLCILGSIPCVIVRVRLCNNIRI